MERGPRRRYGSIRLRGFDYRSARAYFVTVCVQTRGSWFGRVEDGAMRLNAVGHMVTAAWTGLPGQNWGVELDIWVPMPDHLHGIVLLLADASTPAPLSLPDVLRRFKSFTTAEYRAGVRDAG